MSKIRAVSNTFRREEGIAIRINLYVICYIYSHISKAERFIETYKEGGKNRHYPIYSTSFFPLSKPRMNRINNGESFTLSNVQASSIIDSYGIDMKYFRKENPVMFEVKNLGINDWKSFYNFQYGTDYSLHSSINKDSQEKRKLMVEKQLKEAFRDWEHELEKDDPLYAICYFFHYGSRFDKPSTIDMLYEILQEIPVSSWDNQDIRSKQVKEVYSGLERHYKYLSALFELDKLRK